MLRLKSEITINEITFNAIVSVEIESTWQTLTDTCIIQVPNKFKRNGQNITVGDDGFFKRGDAVTVKIGYFPNANTEFTGFIRKIFVDNVIVIECEDSAFLLKQKTLNKSFKSVSVADLLKDISPIPFEAVEAELGAFSIIRSTAAQVTEVLRKPYGLRSFIRSGILKVGLAYYLDEGKEVTLDFEKNIIENDLEFISSEELIIVIQGISIQGKNTKLERFAFYENGEIKITSTDPGIGEVEQFSIKSSIPQKDLDFYITNRLKARISTGTRGTITTFLEPSVAHGDRVKLVSRKFPERAGTFLVKKVIKTFGLDGGRQIITLDTQVV